MAAYLEPYRKNLETLLHKEGTAIDQYLTLVEKKTGVKRVYAVFGLIGILGLYLVFGYGAQLLCNFIGFVYPALESIKAIESRNKEDDTKWLTYWVVYAYLSTIEFFSDILLSWFPFYWLAKCILLVWCFAPSSWNGSTIIYNKVILPLYKKHQSKLDAALQAAGDKVSKLADKGIAAAQEIAGDALLNKND